MAEFTEIQELVRKTRQERGFTMKELEIFTLLNEEIGEVATELKKIWSKNYEGFSKEKMGEEMADVLCCLLALANQFDIDMEEALIDKLIEKDGKRKWLSAKVK